MENIDFYQHDVTRSGVVGRVFYLVCRRPFACNDNIPRIRLDTNNRILGTASAKNRVTESVVSYRLPEQVGKICRIILQYSYRINARIRLFFHERISGYFLYSVVCNKVC